MIKRCLSLLCTLAVLSSCMMPAYAAEPTAVETVESTAVEAAAPANTSQEIIVEIRGEGGTMIVSDNWYTNGYELDVEYNSVFLESDRQIIEDPVHVDDPSKVFEGWAVYGKTLSTDSQGQLAATWTPLNGGTLLNSQQLSNYKLEGYDEIGFIAKWSGEAINPGDIRGECIENEVGYIKVSIRGNGGTFKIKYSFITGGLGWIIEPGQSLANMPGRSSYLIDTDPVNESGYVGKFLGWKVYEEVNGEWVEVPNTELLTTTQILNYTVPVCDGLMFEAQYEEANLVNAVIEGNGGSFPFTEASTTTGCGRDVTPGKTLRDYGYNKVKDPVYMLDKTRVFEGWVAFAKNITTDSDGNEVAYWNPVDGKRLTSAEILDYVIPTCDEFAFFAKWKGAVLDFGTGDTWKNDDGTISAGIQGNGGFFDVFTKGTANGIGKSVKVGTTFAAEGYEVISDPVFNNDSHGDFLGWRPQIVIDGVWTSTGEDRLLTTAEMLNYPIPDCEEFIFKAEYVRLKDDEEEHPPVQQGVFTEINAQNNVFEVQWVWKTTGCGRDVTPGTTMAENGYSIVEEPTEKTVHDGSIRIAFEGWIAYVKTIKADASGKETAYWNPVDGKLLNTAEMLNYPIPTCEEFAFFAKYQGEDIRTWENEVDEETDRLVDGKLCAGIQGNGATFVACDTWKTKKVTADIEPEHTLAEDGYTIVQDPINSDNPDLVFAGWKACVWEDGSWIPCEEPGRYTRFTSEEIVNMKIPECEKFAFFADWKESSIKNIADCEILLDKSYYYTGEEITPVEIVDLEEGEDYTVTYKNNKKRGTATAEITGIGQYEGTVKKTFKIVRTPVSELSVKLKYTTTTYSGKTKKPELTVKNTAGKTLKADTDYTVTYAKGRKDVGRYSVKVTFKGNYEGSKTLYFTILPKAPTSAEAKLYGYDDVKISWKKVTGASGYDVYYKTSSGSYKLLKSTTGTSLKKSDLSDGVKYTFKVVPYYKSGSKTYSSTEYITTSVYTLKELSEPTVTKSGTKVKVQWKNISGESGYQISKSTSKTKTDIVSTYKTTTGTSKVLSATKGKTYYYKVRAFKEVDGKTVYGPWSDVTKFKR